MSSKPKTTPVASQEESTEQLGRMAAFNGETMQAFAQACQAYTSCVSTLNKELMGFVSTRLNRDVELSQALSNCGNWSDAVDLQRQWAQQATEEYMTEAGRITELASKIAKESWEPVYEQTNRMMTDIDKPAQQRL